MLSTGSVCMETLQQPHNTTHSLKSLTKNVSELNAVNTVQRIHSHLSSLNLNLFHFRYDFLCRSVGCFVRSFRRTFCNSIFDAKIVENSTPATYRDKSQIDRCRRRLFLEHVVDRVTRNNIIIYTRCALKIDGK